MSDTLLYMGGRVICKLSALTTPVATRVFKQSYKEAIRLACNRNSREGHREGGLTTRHFFRGIKNSFQQVTGIGLEPHHFFFFLKYPNKYGRKSVQNLG